MEASALVKATNLIVVGVHSVALLEVCNSDLCQSGCHIVPHCAVTLCHTVGKVCTIAISPPFSNMFQIKRSWNPINRTWPGEPRSTGLGARTVRKPWKRSKTG